MMGLFICAQPDYERPKSSFFSGSFGLLIPLSRMTYQAQIALFIGPQSDLLSGSTGLAYRVPMGIFSG